MIETKKISEIEKLEALKDSTNFVVEDDGKTKRFSAEGIRKAMEPNWDVHSPDAPGFIKNKPFYDTGVIRGEEFLSESEFVIDDSSSPAYVVSKDFDYKCDYFIIFDGVEYFCKGNYYESSEYGLFGTFYGNPAKKVKNGSLGDTGEPFLLRGSYRGYTCVEIWSDVGEHTIQMFKAKRDFIKLDEKFIPDSIARVSDILTPDWNQTFEDAPDYVKNRTHGIFWNLSTFLRQDLTGLSYGQTGSYLYWNIPNVNRPVVNPEKWVFEVDGKKYLCCPGQNFEVEGVEVCLKWEPYDSTSLYLYTYTLEFSFMGDKTITVYDVSEEVKKIDKKYLPSDIGVSPDWDARESEKGHIKNRPFHYTVSPGSNVIVEEESKYVPNGDPSYAMLNSNYISLISRDYYTVIFDGVEYLCKCSILSGDMYGAYSVLGNRALVYNLGSSADEKVDTGEPFAIVGGEYYNTYLFSAETGIPHTVKVLDAEVNFVPISEKYLPDGINRNNLLYKPVKEPILDRVLTAKVSGPPNYYFYNLGQAEGVDSSFTEGWLYFKNRYYKFTVEVEFEVTLITESGVVELPVEVRNTDGSFDIASRDSWDTAQFLNLFHDVVRIYPVDGVSFVELPEEYNPTSDYHLATKKYVDSSLSTVVKTEPQSLTRKQKNQIKSNLDIGTGNWGQNDSSKCDFIKNRTHWSNGMKTSKISILSYLLDDEETTTDELGRRVTTLPEADDQPVEGQFYTVFINNQKVPDVLCHRLDSEDETSCLCMGEPADVEFSPLCVTQFRITFNPVTGEVFVAINPEVFGEHINVIAVYQEYEYEDVVPLDKKFLPKVSAVPDATGETVTATEFNALLNALREAGYLKTE